jgi:protein transport protein SEC24
LLLDQITVMARQLAATLPGGTLLSSRESATNTTVSTLAAYRKYCASQSSSVQLILPEALKLMPLFALSLLKGPPLKVSQFLSSSITISANFRILS